VRKAKGTARMHTKKRQLLISRVFSGRQLSRLRCAQQTYRKQQDHIGMLRFE
jgi:hypothetical protein